MNELAETWAETLAAAAEKAHADGRRAVAEYLELKASNDLLRQTASDWLLDSLCSLADAHIRHFRPHSSVKIERHSQHAFDFMQARMVGDAATIAFGVRCLSAECGWTRTPGDGFMRGGALAFARLRHIGVPRYALDLILVPDGETPAWRRIRSRTIEGVVGSNELERYVALLFADQA